MTLLFSVLGGSAPVGEHQQPDTDQEGCSSNPGPLGLAGHGTTHQNIHPLQEPDASHKDQKDTDNVQGNFHDAPICEFAMLIFDNIVTQIPQATTCITIKA